MLDSVYSIVTQFYQATSLTQFIHVDACSYRLPLFPKLYQNILSLLHILLSVEIRFPDFALINSVLQTFVSMASGGTLMQVYPVYVPKRVNNAKFLSKVFGSIYISPYASSQYSISLSTLDIISDVYLSSYRISIYMYRNIYIIIYISSIYI